MPLGTSKDWETRSQRLPSASWMILAGSGEASGLTVPSVLICTITAFLLLFFSSS